MLQIQLLGGFRLSIDGTVIERVNSTRLQAMLTYLLLQRHAPQARQQLAYLFWPDSNDSQARTNLRNALFQLRNSLPDVEHFLQIDTQTIQWRGDAAYRADLVVFEQALENAAQTTQPEQQQQFLAEAVASYTGELTPTLYEDWLITARAQLQARYLAALEQLINLCASQQAYSAAIDYAQRLLQADPLAEHIYCQLMQLHAQTGDRAAALRVYHTCAATLARELGVEPDPATRSVYEHLLKLTSPAQSSPRLPDVSPLIGRQTVWAELQKRWRTVARGHPTLGLVRGEAGIGKTRLVEEFVEWAARQGITAAIAHCYAVGGNLALAPIQSWLRAPIFRQALQDLEPLWASEISRLLPELLIARPTLAPPTPMLESWQRHHLFEALSRVILHPNEPRLLILDDLQWCDDETVEWLQYLFRTQPNARLFVVATYRSAEQATTPLLATWLQSLGRNGQLATWELPRLSAAETNDLAANLLSQPLAALRAEQLYQQSEGVPLFVVEMVRAGFAEGSATAEVGSEQPALPTRVLAVLDARLDTLTPAAQELAGVAALIGRAFPLAVLAAASDQDEDRLIRSLDELWQQHIIRAESAQNLADEWYDFSHEQLRAVAFARLSPIRQRHLHRRVARALTQVYAAQLDAHYAQLASHYEAAGELGLAIDAYGNAARVAHQRSALAEAIGYLQHALQLLAAIPAGPVQDQTELALQAALGPLLLATRGYAAPEVEQTFARAYTLCPPDGDPAQRFELLWWLSRFYLVQPNLAHGLTISQQLLAVAQTTGDSGLLLEATFALGTYHFHRGDFAQAQTLLQQCLDTYDSARHHEHRLRYGQDTGIVAAAYLAWTYWCLGESATARALTTAGLTRAAATNHPYSQVVILTYGGVQEQFAQAPEQCQQYAEQAIQLAEQYGFALWLSMATFLRGWAQSQLGNFAAGFADMQHSIGLYRKSGAELGAAYFMALLAETFARSGQTEMGLGLMPQAFGLLERTQERWCAAELHRIHGEIHRLAGQLAAAKHAFQQAIAVAQTQQARQWALRALVSLAELCQTEPEFPHIQAQLAALLTQTQHNGDVPELLRAQRFL